MHTDLQQNKHLQLSQSIVYIAIHVSKEVVNVTKFCHLYIPILALKLGIITTLTSTFDFI